MVAHCISAGQLTGPRTIYQLHLLTRTSQTKHFCGAASDSPQKLSEVTSLVVVGTLQKNFLNHDRKISHLCCQLFQSSTHISLVREVLSVYITSET